MDISYLLLMIEGVPALCRVHVTGRVTPGGLPRVIDLPTEQNSRGCRLGTRVPYLGPRTLLHRGKPSSLYSQVKAPNGKS